jgi:hypothetical protein
MPQVWSYGGSEVWTSYPTGIQTVSVPKPPPVVQGDLVVIACLYGFGLNANFPSGFAHVTGSPQTFSTNNRLALLWKIATNAEPASYSFTTASGSGGFEAIAILRYVNMAASQSPVTALVTATATTITTASVTTVATDSLVLRVVGTNNAASISIASGTTRVIAGSNFDLMLVGEADKAAIGAAGTVVVTANVSNAMQSITAAFTQNAGALTHSVSGIGNFVIQSPGAIRVQLTGSFGSIGVARGNPVRYFEIGSVSFGTANGQMRNYYLQHADELIIAPFSNASTLYYSLRSGLTATITELPTP